MISTRIVAAGAFLPERAISNERLVKAIPGWQPEKIALKTGILERRFLWDFDDETGRAIVPKDGSIWPRTNTDMCEAALRQALERGDVKPSEIDAIFVVTCTPDELNFSHDAVVLHQRLGCRADAMALVID
ncbi:MAG: 3-ketoacyl-ACP synthase, partial [Deltaproteobacteria bacterium]|nr:3-ketoacyl-ACP synthase [Deltaproteobacteria bacterium]